MPLFTVDCRDTLKPSLQVKICGITQIEQGVAIARLGAAALGFICVQTSPRYVEPPKIRAVVEAVQADLLSLTQGQMPLFVGVFANAPLNQIKSTVAIAGLTAVQLHGDESPQFCRQLLNTLPQVKLIKAFRVKHAKTLEQIGAYQNSVDGFLLDAYHPHQLGGTGHRLDGALLKEFQPGKAWFLAGGLNPSNIAEALALLQPNRPDGIDLSSGVERSPGDKDMAKVAQLFKMLEARSYSSS